MCSFHQGGEHVLEPLMEMRTVDWSTSEQNIWMFDDGTGGDHRARNTDGKLRQESDDAAEEPPANHLKGLQGFSITHTHTPHTRSVKGRNTSSTRLNRAVLCQVMGSISSYFQLLFVPIGHQALNR